MSNRHSKLFAEFSPKIGQLFDGNLEHWSEHEKIKPIFAIKGEILEVKPTGLCIDDGNGDEVFVSFDLISKHRAQMRRDYLCDFGNPLL